MGENCIHLLKCQQTKLQILWMHPSTQMMPNIWEEIHEVQQDEPFPRCFWECKRQSSPQYEAGSRPRLGRRKSHWHNEYKFQIFNSNHSVITANLKTSSNNVIITVPYKIDTSSNGNVMPLHIYKKVFPRATKEQLMATRNTNIQLKCIREELQ